MQTYVPDDSDINARRLKRRLSQKDFTDSYFSLSPESDSWGRSEFETIIKGSPSDAFTQLTEKVGRTSKSKRSDVRRIFLELLDSKFSSAPELNQEWLNAIIAASPDLLSEKDEESKFLFSVDNEDRLRWIIVNGLRQLSPAAQIGLLKSAIITAGDLTVLTDVVRGIIGDANPDYTKAHREGFDFGDDESVIRNLLLDRVRVAAATGDIWGQARPDRLLWFWSGSGAASELSTFADKAMTSSVGLRKLLEITIGKVRSTAGDYERVPKSWEKIVDLNALRKLASELIEAPNDDSDIKLARRFLDALEKSKSSSF